MSYFVNLFEMWESESTVRDLVSMLVAPTIESGGRCLGLCLVCTCALSEEVLYVTVVFVRIEYLQTEGLACCSKELIAGYEDP